MLRLVKFTGLDAFDGDAEAIHSETDLEQAVRSVPLHELRPDDARIGAERLPDH